MGNFFHCSLLYVGLALNSKLTTESQLDSLTDRVVQYSLDGRERTTLVSSQYKLKSMALDDPGKCHRIQRQ